jgi:formylglycine-generating enzyme required for sulfatase activity
MSDIFISYARADRKRVRTFAEALEKRGWRVWWDQRIRSGSSFDRVIEQALSEARCIVVIWSQNSVESDWVRVEAGDGLERDILVSISIEQELRLPLRFRNVHTDLVLDLAVNRALPVFNKIVEDIEAIIDRAKPESAMTDAEAQQKDEVVKPKEKELSKQQKAFKNTLGMTFVLIPTGTFTMGSKKGNKLLSFFSSKHTYKVNILRPFYLQTTPVSQSQWLRVMENSPSNFKDLGDKCPVENITWYDAQEFIKILNKKEGTDQYRLPAEAEWEYACRAGNSNEFSFGSDVKMLGEYAWFSGNSARKTHPVGSKKPNAWGLFDMHGNVWEWVEDDWHSNFDWPLKEGEAWIDESRGVYRVLRGGSWFNNASYCSSVARDFYKPDDHRTNIGFRLAWSITIGP